jgi:hypothetical protein
MRKTVYVVLDILLILGALVCVATINGGKWWIDGMTHYIAIQTAFYASYLPPAAVNDSGNAKPGIGSQMETNCQASSSASTPKWYNILRMFSTNSNKQVQPAPAAQGLNC